MIKDRSQGLAKVGEIYQNRSDRAKELRAEGKKVIGYFCIYPVLEMLTALDIVPHRILGDSRETITRADTCLPSTVCSFVRSCLDLALKGQYDFLDGVVMAHTCDIVEKLNYIWKIYQKPPYFHFLDIPHTANRAAIRLHKQLLEEFKQTLESFTGKELTREKLIEAIKDHNQQRALVRELYDLRKPDPPLISGTETLQVMVALMSLPVNEGNSLLRQVISEVKERNIGSPKKLPRLLVWGSIIDDTALLGMIEDLEANVVIDDTCVGSRAYFPDVEITDNPLDGLASRYLADLKCPRTFQETSLENANKKNYMNDLESRFGYLRDYASEWNVDGVILQSLRYCDTHGYEVPGLKYYLDSIGLPSIYLECNYSDASLAMQKTRVQAFLEVIN